MVRQQKSQNQIRSCAFWITSEIFSCICLSKVSQNGHLGPKTALQTNSNYFLDRLGGAKADRRKEAAISTAVETYLRNHQSERADGRMSRGKMVLFFKFCFPLFLEIVLKVIRQETTKGKIPSFKNDSVFSNSSKIPYIETDH